MAPASRRSISFQSPRVRGTRGSRGRRGGALGCSTFQRCAASICLQVPRPLRAKSSHVQRAEVRAGNSGSITQYLVPCSGFRTSRRGYTSAQRRRTSSGSSIDRARRSSLATLSAWGTRPRDGPRCAGATDESRGFREITRFSRDLPPMDRGPTPRAFGPSGQPSHPCDRGPLPGRGPTRGRVRERRTVRRRTMERLRPGGTPVLLSRTGRVGTRVVRKSLGGVSPSIDSGTAAGPSL